jgi:chromosome partitioning protein
MSFYFNEGIPYDEIRQKNVFKVFTGTPVNENIFHISKQLDLLHADVRLSSFRSIGNFKVLKKALENLNYDFVVIDTAPTFDNIIINVLVASNILLIPVQQDVFNYQSAKYLFEELRELELRNLDINIILNQYERPRTENKNAYSNQLIDLFTEDDELTAFINPIRISKSSVIKKYINDQNYHISTRVETKRQYEELSSLIKSVTRISIEEDI